MHMVRYKQHVDARPPNADHEQRMRGVQHYIDSHLADSLSLEVLAEVAHLSSFHFHRVFAMWSGQTVAEYVAQRRIEVAAARLAAQPHMRVLPLALSVGFGSAEAFSRAFRRRFAMSPSQWRTHYQKLSKMDQVQRKLDQDAQWPIVHNQASKQKRNPLSVRVSAMASQPVAYLPYQGELGPKVNTFWSERVMPWIAELGLQNQARFGVSHDDPSVANPKQCRYDACVALPEGYVGPRGLLRGLIPQGIYASSHFVGDAQAITIAWMVMLRDWMPSTGWQLDARPCFEYYPSNGVSVDAAAPIDCDICLPVMPL